jgi:ferredoxin
MIKLMIDGIVSLVSGERRLVLAIEDSGVSIGHRCGGWAKCTTCRVEFDAGEPDKMTKAEYDRLIKNDLLGVVRLSCQIICDHPMSLHPLITSAIRPDWAGDTGPAPEVNITPEAVWYSLDELRRTSE